MVIGLYQKALCGSVDHSEILEAKRVLACACTEAKVLNRPYSEFTRLSNDIGFLEDCL